MRAQLRGWLLMSGLLAAAGAAAQSGGGYNLTWNTVDGGGITFATGGAYTLGATSGQPDAGNHAAAAYTLSGGYWYAPTAQFSVAKDYNDNNPAPVTVALTCTTGVVSPPTALASEATPASFSVSGFIGSPICTATEIVPVNYTANQAGCAAVALALGGCTIVNTLNLADLAVTLSDTPDPVIAGSNLSYLATLTNNGPSDALGANIALPLPATTTFVSAVPSAGGSCTTPAVGSNGSVNCTWTGATPPGAGNARSVTVLALVPADTADASVLSATATVASNTSDPGPAPNTATATTIVNAAADLAIALSDAPDPVIAGGNLSYLATLTNNGLSDAQGANIALPLPATTTFVSAVPSAGGSCTTPAVGSNGSVNCTWTGATPPGAGNARSVTVQALVPANVLAGNVLSATATAASTTTDPGPAPNTATATTTVSAAADLAITLADSPDPVIAGGNLSYLATLTNNGLSDAQDASIALPLPATTTFVSAVPSAGGSCTTPAVGSTGSVLCTWAGATAPGGGNARSVTVLALVPANSPDGSVLTATATAASTTTDPGPAPNTATATTTVSATADLAITLVDTPDPVVAGANLSYLATLTNNGLSDAQDASIALPLPASTTFVSANASAGGSCTTPAVGANGSINCIWAGATAPGAGSARSVTVLALVPASTADASVLSATATAASTTTDPGPAPNTATATTTVSAAADLAITLADSPDPVIAGGNLSYLATLTNNGLSDAQDASIALPLPATTTFVSAVPSAGGSCTTPAVGSTGSVICTWAGATAPAATRSISVIAAVASGVANGAQLTATATAGSTTSDPTSANNSATAITAVNTSADLAITLTDAPDPVVAGAQLTYTANVSNAGPSDASGISIQLPLPAGTSLLSGSVSGGGSCAGTPVVCTFTGSLTPGATRSATILVAVAPSVLAGSVLNATVTVSAATPDPTPGNNFASTSTTVSTSADLLINLSASASQVIVNVPVTFTASSLNQGPSDAQNVSITLTLSPDFRYSSQVAAGASACSAPQVGTTGAIVCTWAGATTSGQTRQLQVIAYSNVQGASTVNASTRADTPDPQPDNNLANLSIQVGYLVKAIPALGGYGLALLALLLVLGGGVAVRRRG